MECKKNKIWFSCIVTCYNREKTIARAINSILSQEYRYFEIIVVDDCSIDNSVKVISEINNPKVKLIKHFDNQGQNAALNTGVKNAAYEYCAFLDSDDLWRPNFLSEFEKVFRMNLNCQFAYCRLVNGEKWLLEGRKKYSDVLNQGYLTTMDTIVVLKKCIYDIGGFDPDPKIRCCQDDDFCFKLSKNYDFVLIPKELAEYIGEENSMTKIKIDVLNAKITLFKLYRKDILKNCGPWTYSKHLLTLVQLSISSDKYSLAFKFLILSIIYYLFPIKNKYNFNLFYKFYLIIKHLKCHLIENKLKPFITKKKY